MRFKISRVSEWRSDVVPCVEAKLEDCVMLDIRTLKSPEEYDSRFGNSGTWLSKGRNHCINKDGFIQREFDSKDWFIYIDTLEELIKFKHKYGDIIIRNSYSNPREKEIVIYDDYIE